MFGFWKKSSVELLGDIESGLDAMPDHAKLSFIERHLPKIKKAMQDDPLPVAHDHGFHSAFDENITETMETAFGYLEWHYKILETLRDEDESVWDMDNLSPAAKYFFEETEADAITAFHRIFMLNPLVAIRNLAPAPLFKKTILDAMDSLTSHRNPHLYFACYDAIDYGDENADTSCMKQRLIDATLRALENMLYKEPEALLFPHSGAFARPTTCKTFLFYLPEGAAREVFLATHAEKIDAEFDAYAETMGESQIDSYLLDQKIILTERIKMCFHAAATGDQTELDRLMTSLDGKQSDHVVMYSHYVGLPILAEDKKHLIPEPFNPDPFTPVYEMIRLTNPSAAENAQDKQDKYDGIYSKYLWMIRRGDTVLSTSFSKAGMADYLRDQKQLPTGPLPSVMDWDGFLYEGATGNPNRDLVLEQ